MVAIGGSLEAAQLQCLVPGVMEALNLGKNERHASTEEVPR